MGSEANLSVANIIVDLILVTIIILPTFLLSQLTKIEYENFRDQWIKDGKPHGKPFWYPSDEMSKLGFFSYPWFIGTWWLVKTPEWARKHKTASKILMYYRIISYLIYSSGFGICLMTIFSSPR